MDNTYKTYKIVMIEKESNKVKNFILDGSLDAKPGQYIMVWIPRVNEKPFGVVSSSPLTISVAKVGPFTEIIHALKKGDSISFRGPYGRPYIRKGKRLLFVAGGYGVVPLHFFAESIIKTDRKKIDVILGARSKKDLVFIKKFRALGCNVLVSTDDGSIGFKGFAPDFARHQMDRTKYDSVYTCGPMKMMQKVVELCADKKVPCQASVESYFKCGGMGLCGACSVNGFLACTDGPVVSGKIFSELLDGKV